MQVYLLTLSSGLRITLLDIPSPLMVGESAELTCNYDLEAKTLYSFKWYKDGIEFYRYVPRDYPQTQYLKMAGINVDVSYLVIFTFIIDPVAHSHHS